MLSLSGLFYYFPGPGKTRPCDRIRDISRGQDFPGKYQPSSDCGVQTSALEGAKSTVVYLAGLLMAAMMSGNTPRATPARARGLRKQRGVHGKTFARDEREERNGDDGSSHGENRDGGDSGSGDGQVTGGDASIAKTLPEATNAGPDSAAVEDEEDGVEHGGAQDETGDQPADEPESPAAGLVSGEKTRGETDAEGKMIPKAAAKAALYVPKRSRRSRAKQRREGAVSNHDLGGDVAEDSESRYFKKDLPRSRSDDGRGGPGGGVAAGALPEHGVTDGQEWTGLEEEEDVECVAIGPCVQCEEPTLDVEYCKETGRRQEVRCSPRDAPDAFAIVRQEGQAGVVGLPSSIQYRSCEYTEEDELQGLLRFWISMVILGVVACFGMRRRQKKIKSLYDQRAM